MRKLFYVSVFFLVACSTKQVTTGNVNTDGTITGNGKLFATLYQQRAAEYRALCFQAFNIARYRVDEYKSLSSKPKAIVTDIDETVLDNSKYEAGRALQGKEYDPQTWNEWTAMGIADTLPGAVTFLKYAASKGITIFYVTNRDQKERTGTMKNLQRYNLPNADEAHLITRQNVSSKETRRQSINSTHEIMLFLGDNLADFSALFDKKSVDERLKNTNFSASDFGNRFIVLPNPVYGDWETSLYNYNYKLTRIQKDSIIRKEVKAN